jgi:uncharacterized protein
LLVCPIVILTFLDFVMNLLLLPFFAVAALHASEPSKQNANQVATVSELAARCDALAAHPFDISKPANIAGVDFHDLDAEAALLACQAAFANDPTPRLQFQLARALEANKLVDLARAGFKAAADKGHRRAMFSLGYSYWDDDIGSYEPEKALPWFTKAAEAGETDAMFNIASAHLNGIVVKKSKAQALVWFKKSAQNGDEEALTWVEMLESELDE